MAWSILFRSRATFSNYLRHVRLACEVTQFSVEVFSRPEIRRARVAVMEERAFKPRPRTFVRLVMSQKLMPLMWDNEQLGLWIMNDVFVYI